MRYDESEKRRFIGWLDRTAGEVRRLPEGIEGRNSESRSAGIDDKQIIEIPILEERQRIAAGEGRLAIRHADGTVA